MLELVPVLFEALNLVLIIRDLFEFGMKLFVALALFPDFHVLGALTLCGKAAQSDGLLIKPDALLFQKLFLELSEDLDVRLDKDLLLSFLLLEDTLYLFDLSIESVQKMVASVDLEFFLLKNTVLIFDFTA